MATRTEILQALALAPSWQRRARQGLGSAPSIDGEAAPRDSAAAPAAVVPLRAATVTQTGSPAPAAIPPRPETPDDRRQQIATLTWPVFAQHVASCTACALHRTRNKVVPGVGDV